MAGESISLFPDRWWILGGDWFIGKGKLHKNTKKKMVKKTFKWEYIICWFDDWNTHKPNNPWDNQGFGNIFEVLTLAGHKENKHFAIVT